MSRAGLGRDSAIGNKEQEPLAVAVRSRTFATLIESADYRKYFVGHGISLIGTWMQQAAVLWLVLVLTESEWWLGVIDAAGVLPGVLVALFAGALADRVEPRRMVVAMLVAQTALAATLALLVWTSRIQVWHMAVILAMNRVCVTFEMPSRQVMLYGIVGRDRLMNAIALNSGLFNASRVVGPAVAGLLLARMGSGACFGLNALSFLAAIAAALAIRPIPRPATDKAATSVLGGLRFLRSQGRVRLLFALMFAFGVIGMGYSALVPAYARKELGVGPLGYSLLLSSAGVGATLGALLVASLGGMRRKEWLVLLGMGVFGLSLAGAGLVPQLAAGTGLYGPRFVTACACFASAGFGGLLFYSATQTLVQLTAPDHVRGRVIGIWMVAFSGSVPLGSLWFGLAAQWVGVSNVLLFAGGLNGVLALAALASGLVASRESERESLTEPAPEG